MRSWLFLVVSIAVPLLALVFRDGFFGTTVDGKPVESRKVTRGVAAAAA